jgi:hypothetical protein
VAPEKRREFVRGTRVRPGSIQLGACTAVLLAVVSACPAEAQSVFQLDGSVALNYSVTTPSSLEDRGLTTQVIPAVTFQTGSPKLVFRIGYLFAGNFNIYGSGSNYYSNLLRLSLAFQPAAGSTLTIDASVTQGGTAFQNSQRPADQGQPVIRAPGNPDQISATLSEAFTWEASRSMRMTQGFSASVVAPEYNLDRTNSLVSLSLGLDHMGQRDAIGGTLSSSVALLRPTLSGGDPFYSLANSLVGNWSRDFSQNWNGQLAAGLSNVIQLDGNHMTAFVPTAAATVRYFANDVGRSGGSVSLGYGPTFNLYTGTLTQAVSISGRGFVNFNSPWARTLSFSAGYLRSWAVNEAAALNAAGLGHAVQGDIGLVWGLSSALLVSARGSIAYQFGQPDGLAPSMSYIFLVGITGRYSNATSMSAVPTIGGRVDGADGARFPGAQGVKP